MPGIGSDLAFSVMRPTNMSPTMLFSQAPDDLCGSSESGSPELQMSSDLLARSKPMTGLLAHAPSEAAAVSPPAPTSRDLRLVQSAMFLPPPARRPSRLTNL